MLTELEDIPDNIKQIILSCPNQDENQVFINACEKGHIEVIKYLNNIGKYYRFQLEKFILYKIFKDSD